MKPTCHLVKIAFCVTIGWLHASLTEGHGVPIVVTESEGRLLIPSRPPTGEFLDDGFDVATEDPGIGVLSTPNGLAPGTALELQLVGGLSYWDGVTIAESTATLTIEAPEFDSEGMPNATPVDEYLVEADSAGQTGMAWSTYPGVALWTTWDAHGYFVLSEGAPDGVYGVPVRLGSPTLESSDPFLLTFALRNGAAWNTQEGTDALWSAFNEPAVGDFNRDGQVDTLDHAAWVTGFGGAVSPGAGADGNGDGLIDAADYTVWRDAMADPTSAGSIPEPSSGTSLVLAWSVIGAVWRRSRRT